MRHEPVPLDLVHLHPQVVKIRRFAVQQFAQHALAAEIQAEQLFPAVTGVFHHHAVPPGLLRRFHQLPALVERDAGGHLGKGDLAGLHRVDGHAGMPLPGSGDDHDVDVVALQHSLVIFIPFAEPGRLLAAGLLHGINGLFHGGLVVVANGGDLHPFQRQHLLQMPRAAAPHPDERRTHRFQPRKLRFGGTCDSGGQLVRQRAANRQRGAGAPQYLEKIATRLLGGIHKRPP